MTSSISIRSKIIKTIINSIFAKKGENVSVLQVGKIENTLYEFLVVCEVMNFRQASAVVDELEESIWKNCQRKPLCVDGLGQSEWVVLDYEDVIVHVMTKQQRNFYQLEDLWLDVPRFDFKD